jgi:tyramine---L-glutamate ligase
MTGMSRITFRPTVLVYEFFTGGGCPAGTPPAGLASEALGMLWALLTDFRSLGSLRTVAAFDPRFEEQIPGLNRKTLPADEVVEAGNDDPVESFSVLIQRCDAVLIIAPETNGILARLTAQAESAGIPVLGSSASAVEIAGNKAECHRLFAEAGLANPRTQKVTFAMASGVAEQIGFPLVIKPVDGVGSEGVHRVDRFSDLASAIDRVRGDASRDEVLVQTFVPGVPASVSLLACGDRCLPLSLNRQLIGPGLRYSGSEVPFEHSARERAMKLACSAVGLIPGLNGYAGVDLVLAGEGASVLEINPRLTTSYIGLRQVVQTNLAGAIWDACINGILPEKAPLAGWVMIKKDNPATWNLGKSRGNFQDNRAWSAKT